MGEYKCKNMLVFEASADDAILDAFNASAAISKNGKIAFITEEISEKELADKLAALKDAPVSRIRLL